MTEAWAMAFALWGAIAAFVVFIVVDEWGGLSELVKRIIKGKSK